MLRGTQSPAFEEGQRIYPRRACKLRNTSCPRSLTDVRGADLPSTLSTFAMLLSRAPLIHIAARPRLFAPLTS